MVSNNYLVAEIILYCFYLFNKSYTTNILPIINCSLRSMIYFKKYKGFVLDFKKVNLFYFHQMVFKISDFAKKKWINLLKHHFLKSCVNE